jgi:hypothetical protein
VLEDGSRPSGSRLRGEKMLHGLANQGIALDPASLGKPIQPLHGLFIQVHVEVHGGLAT